jgi:hypothetical protein
MGPMPSISQVSPASTVPRRSASSEANRIVSLGGRTPPSLSSMSLSVSVWWSWAARAMATMASAA